MGRWGCQHFAHSSAQPSSRAASPAGGNRVRPPHSSASDSECNKTQTQLLLPTPTSLQAMAGKRLHFQGS